MTKMQVQLLKITLAGVTGLLGSFFGAYVPVLCCVLFAICFDVLTGLIRAKITGEAINSKTGTIGFWKKLALLLGLFFGIFLDIFIPMVLDIVTINLPFKLPIGTIVGCYIVLNEAISILENLNKSGVFLPKWIKTLLKGTKDTINTGGVNEQDRKANRNSTKQSK